MRTVVRSAVVGLLVCSLASCGDDDDADASGGSGTTSEETTGTTEATAEPTGEPIKVMVIAPLEAGPLPQPQILDAAEAAAEFINEDGGIGGRPVEVTGCDEKSDSNEGQRCARMAVSEGYVAVVGAFTADDAIVPILEEAGIPLVAPMSLVGTYFQSPISFPLQNGPLDLLGLGPILVDEGAQRITILGTEGVEAAQIAIDFATRGVEEAGAEVGQTVTIPFGAPDVAPQVAQALEDSDGVIVLLGPAETAKVLVAAQQMSAEVPFAATAGFFDENFVNELGEAAEGVFLTSDFLPLTTDHEEAQRFLEEMEASAPDASTTTTALNAWLGMQMLKEVAEPLDSVDAASLLEALGSVENLDLGLVPPITTTEENPVPELARIFNTSTYFLRVVDGAVVAVSEEPVELG